MRRPRGNVLRWAVAPAAALLVAACGGGADAGEPAAGSAAAGDSVWACRITTGEVNLGPFVSEASGAALDPRAKGVFWTHGDSGQPPLLYGLDAGGQLAARVRVRGAANRDWEDMSLGPCPGGTCVYVGDIGNNAARDLDLVLYRAPLPALSDTVTAPAEAFRARFPGPGRDAEALFVTPQGEVYLVTKGQTGSVELWRWPTPLAAGPVELERVRQLAPRPGHVGDFVTGAGVSADGRWVALRTYGRLALYRTADLLGEGEPAFTLDLVPLGEAFGEAVALESDGTVLLVSEGRGTATGSRAAWLQCTMPES